ncbi:DedA family protein [Rhizobium panacihumi]|uniref:DedA family protein n=1 Tax=Rhizobium panacihumi TaxID=2008450 RepID=UPI003D7B23AA
MDPLGSIIEWMAVYGAVGLLAVGIAERFIPVMPSYGVLVAIGVAAAGGTWSVPIAIAMTTFGSFMGGLAMYLFAVALGQSKATRLLYWIGRWLGLSRSRIEKTVSSFQMRAGTLVFISQLIPTIRLIAPLVAGLIGTDIRRFSGATVLGIVLWNSLFIFVGYVAVLVVPEINTSALALKVLILLIIAEAIVALFWRLLSRRSRRLSFSESAS